MCNIAGYVGSRPAAPLLIDMMRRQEGLCGGFYTGIATLHEGKIYYAKLTGDLDRLLAETEAARLPGTIGIIHSRSKSGGGDPWAHPFVGERDGVVRTAYVANGETGWFHPRMAAYNRLAEDLLGQGYTMHSQVKAESDAYNLLSDGTAVHMSDVMSQLILRNMERGADAPTAMGEAYGEMPGEIVGLLLSLAEPNSIAYSRISYPMALSFADHGAYLASTALAFPADAGTPQILPVCSCGRVTRNKVEIIPFVQPPCVIADLDMNILRGVYDVVCTLLRYGRKNMSDLVISAKAVFPPADVAVTDLAVYEALRWLQQEGKIKIESVPVAGAAPGLTAPKFYVSLV
ncbi:MAG: hypothetical protein IJO76_03520 [Clostridia bacterium]|nr:hypothetical protein [Clostridia bacterium]